MSVRCSDAGLSILLSQLIMQMSPYPSKLGIKGLMMTNPELFQVQATHTQIPRTYTVIDVGELGAARQTFPLDVGEGRTVQCTVEKYFMDTYRKRLRYPQLNCLKVGPIHRNIFIPIEVSFLCCEYGISRHFL